MRQPSVAFFTQKVGLERGKVPSRTWLDHAVTATAVSRNTSILARDRFRAAVHNPLEAQREFPPGIYRHTRE